MARLGKGISSPAAEPSGDSSGSASGERKRGEREGEREGERGGGGLRASLRPVATGRRGRARSLLVSPQRTPPPADSLGGGPSAAARASRERAVRRVTSPTPYRLIYENGSDTETMRRLSSQNRALLVTPPRMVQEDREIGEDGEGQLHTRSTVHSDPLSAAARILPEHLKLSPPRDDLSTTSSSSLSASPTVPRCVRSLSDGSARHRASTRQIDYPIFDLNERWTFSDDEETNRKHVSGGDMRRSEGTSGLTLSPKHLVLPDTSEIMRSFFKLQFRKESEVLVEYETKGRDDVMNLYMSETQKLLVDHAFHLGMLHTSSASASDTSPKKRSLSPPALASPRPLSPPNTRSSGTRHASWHDISSPKPRRQVSAVRKLSACEPKDLLYVAEVSLLQLFADEIAARQSITDAAADELHFLLRYRRLVEAALNPSALLLREANQRQSILIAAAVSAQCIQSTQRSSLLKRAHRLAALVENEESTRFTEYVSAEARERRRLGKLFADEYTALHTELSEVRRRARRAVHHLLLEEQATREDIAFEELRSRRTIYTSGSRANASMRVMGDGSVVVVTNDSHTSATGSFECMENVSTTPTPPTTTVSMAHTLPMVISHTKDVSPSDGAQMQWAMANATNVRSTVGEQFFFEWNPTSNTLTRTTATTVGTPTMSTGGTVLLSSSHDLSAVYNPVRLFGSPSPTPKFVDTSVNSSSHARHVQSSKGTKEEEEDGGGADDDGKEALNRRGEQKQGEQQASFKMTVLGDDVDDDFSGGGIRDLTCNSPKYDLMDRDVANVTDGKKSLPTKTKKSSRGVKTPIDWKRPVNRHIVPCSVERKGTLFARDTSMTPSGRLYSHYNPAQGMETSAKRPYHDDIIFGGAPLKSREAEGVDRICQGEVRGDIEDDISGPSSSSSASLADSPTQSAHKYPLQFGELKEGHEEEIKDFESVEELESIQDICIRSTHSHDETSEREGDSLSETNSASLHEAAQSKGRHNPPNGEEKTFQERPDMIDSREPRPSTMPDLTLSATCDAGGDFSRSASRLSRASGRAPRHYMRTTMSWRRQHEQLEWLPRPRHSAAALQSAPAGRRSQSARRRVRRAPFEEGPGVWSALPEPRRPFDFDPAGERAHQASRRAGREKSRERSGARAEEEEEEEDVAATIVQSARCARDAARRFMAGGSLPFSHSSTRNTLRGANGADILLTTLRGVIAQRSASSPMRSSSEAGRKATTPSYVDAFFRLTPREAGRKGFLAALRGESAIRDTTPLRFHTSLSSRNSRSKSKTSAGIANYAQSSEEHTGDLMFIQDATKMSWSPQPKPWK